MNIRRPLCAAALVYCLAVLALLQLMPPETEDFQEYDRSMVTLCGTVVSKEYKSSDDGSVRLLVTLRNCVLDGWSDQPENLVMCRVGDGTSESAEEADERMRIGAEATVRGKLYVYEHATNSGEFDSAQYYQILGYTSFQIQYGELISVSGEGSMPDNVLYRVKRFLSDVLDACLEDEDAQVLKAMLLGEKGTLSSRISDLYQSSGIVHILAISGLHISIMGMGMLRLLRKTGLPLPVSAAAAVLLMLLYGRMTGMSASSFRAIVMFMLRMLALVRHRTYDLLTGISFAGLLLLLWQPLYLYHTGFLFSFSAVLGIALLTPAFSSRGMKALSVTLGILPVQLTCYGTFSIYTVVLNLLVLPLMSTVMVSGLAVLALGSIFPAAGKAAGLAVHAILLFYEALCTAAGSLPWHQINLGAPYLWEILLYLGILALIAATAVPQKRFSAERLTSWLPEAYREYLDQHETLLPELLRTAAASAAVLILCFRCTGGLNLHVVDAGQGDALLIRSDGVNILIDGGSTSKTSLSEYQLTPLLQYYGVRELDYVIITHADSDHMNGALEVILQSRTHRSGMAGLFTDDSENGITVGALCLPSAAASAQNENYQQLVEAAEEKNIPIVYLKEGDVMEGSRLRILCLHPEKECGYAEANEMSVTLWLEYGAFTALLTGDLEGEGEERFLEYVTEGAGAELLPSGDDGTITLTLLKVAHHGSSGATSEAFLEIFQPKLAVVSCGVGNVYGHPHEATLERLYRAGIQTLYDTRTGGEITFHTDGRALRITQYGGAMEY